MTYRGIYTEDCHKENNRTADCHSQESKFESGFDCQGVVPVVAIRGIHKRAVCQGVILVVANLGNGAPFATTE
jgi:hypothetical protein